MKRLLICIVLLSCFALSSMAQTEVTLHFNNNASSQSFNISEAGKLYFDNGYLYIDDGTMVPYSFEVSTIQKVLLASTMEIEEIVTPDFNIYPNPASSFLRISSSDHSNTAYQIFSLDGRLMLSGVCMPEESIDVSHLSNGLYLVKVNNKTFKITKL